MMRTGMGFHNFPDAAPQAAPVAAPLTLPMGHGMAAGGAGPARIRQGADRPVGSLNFFSAGLNRAGCPAGPALAGAASGLQASRIWSPMARSQRSGPLR